MDDVINVGQGEVLEMEKQPEVLEEEPKFLEELERLHLIISIADVDIPRRDIELLGVQKMHVEAKIQETKDLVDTNTKKAEEMIKTLSVKYALKDTQWSFDKTTGKIIVQKKE